MSKKDTEHWAQDGERRYKLEGKELEQFLQEKEDAQLAEEIQVAKKKAIFEKLGLTEEEIKTIL
jgi:hypothetical protein